MFTQKDLLYAWTLLNKRLNNAQVCGLIWAVRLLCGADQILIEYSNKVIKQEAAYMRKLKVYFSSEKYLQYVLEEIVNMDWYKCFLMVTTNYVFEKNYIFRDLKISFLYIKEKQIKNTRQIIKSLEFPGINSLYPNIP